MKKLVFVSALGGVLVVALVFASLWLVGGASAQATDTPTSTVVATEAATMAATEAATVAATEAPTVAATEAATIAAPTSTVVTGGVATGTPGALPRTGGESSPIGLVLLAGLGALVALTGFALRRRLA